MADFVYNAASFVVFDSVLQTYNFTLDGAALDGTVSDGDPASDAFTDGEPLTATWLGAGNFYGTIAIDGFTLILVTTANPTRFAAYTEVDDPETFTLYGRTFTDDQIDRDPFLVCFAAGTPIATPLGEVAVETLRAGDLVLTADGRAVAVKWLARQTVHKLFTAELRFRPVRIMAGALGEKVPHSDLVVTADHGLMLDGLVIQAGALVNGTTIERVPSGDLSDTVTYFHVETDAHDAILAAGVPAETFVDNVTRRRFDNYAEYEALFGDTGGAIAEMGAPRVKSARQLPRALRELVDARAVALTGPAATAA